MWAIIFAVAIFAIINAVYQATKGYYKNNTNYLSINDPIKKDFRFPVDKQTTVNKKPLALGEHPARPATTDIEIAERKKDAKEGKEITSVNPIINNHNQITEEVKKRHRRTYKGFTDDNINSLNDRIVNHARNHNYVILDISLTAIRNEARVQTKIYAIVTFSDGYDD